MARQVARRTLNFASLNPGYACCVRPGGVPEFKEFSGDQMSDGRIGIIGDAGGLESMALVSDSNFDEYNRIVMLPYVLKAQLLQSSEYLPIARADRARRRLSDLETWVSDGHTLIVILNQFHEQVPVMNWSGTGYDEPLEIAKLFPLSLISVERSAGKRIEFCGTPAIDSFQIWLEKLHYQLIIRNDDLLPLLRVSRAGSGEAQIVGGMKHHGAGCVLFFPPLNPASVLQQRDYFLALSNLPQLLQAHQNPLPPWVTRFKNENEAAASRDIEELEAKIAALQMQIASNQSAIDAAYPLKSLFAATGTAFEEAVLSALQEIGLHTIAGPHPRADLLAFHRNRIVAVEAKGLDGCAREVDLRQTEKWVFEVKTTVELPAQERSTDPDFVRYAEQLKTLGVPIDESESKFQCKGVLIVGTFKSAPLDQRTQPNFPDALIRKIETSKVCALTGLQLLGLVLQVRKDSNLKDTIVDEIFSTNGLLGRAEDWRKFLSSQ
jgi:hypothetical protein